MVYTANVLQALIASPGDTLGARDAIERAINGWNSDRSRAASIVVLPRRWETDAVPLLGGGDGQQVINDQLVAEADILFGVFYSRLGQPTARGLSGTAEEIQQAVDAGKRVHVYFAESPLPPDVDLEKLAALRVFKEDMQARGLYGSFLSEDDLAAKVRTALEADLVALDLSEAPPIARRGPRVALRGTYESDREAYNDAKGRIKYRTRGQTLVVTNHGSELARAVTVSMESLDEGHPAPDFWGVEDVRPDIPPGGSYRYGFSPHMGTAMNVNVHFAWQDDDGQHETQHSLALR